MTLDLKELRENAKVAVIFSPSAMSGVPWSNNRLHPEHVLALLDLVKELREALENYGARLQCAVCGGVGEHRTVSRIWYCDQGKTARHPDVAYAIEKARGA